MEEKAQEQKVKGDKPSWRGEINVAGWKKTDSNGKEYIVLKMSQYCNLFKVEDKQQEKLKD